MRRDTEKLEHGRKVFTLYGERFAYDSSNPGEDEDSIVRGYATMTEYVETTFKNATIHSVSFSNVIFPTPSSRYHMWLFATVVYSGEMEKSSITQPYEGMGEALVQREYL